jgi:tRNA (mo5U34)-methyltransferase
VDSLEARLAFRSRVLDYIWAGVPMVVSQGDATSDIVKEYGMGLVVGCGSVGGVTEAITELLEGLSGTSAGSFVQAQTALTWERVAQPLLAFCEAPVRAADRRSASATLQREMEMEAKVDVDTLKRQVADLEWYHTIDLGGGVVTPGAYDHRPYLPNYGIPEDLSGKTVLDVGAASGFFSFEMERRGAKVTALDLPAWFSHDFGPNYVPDKTAEDGERYLHEPLELARHALRSRVDRIDMTVYDISRESVGTYDVVFCGSLLVHLADPIRALWQIQEVTGELAIIATSIEPQAGREPHARFVGHVRGDGWWIPNRACLEAMVESAGFAGWEWYSDFQLNYANGEPGPYHGVIRAWNTPERPPASYMGSVGGWDGGAQRESSGSSQIATARDAELVRLRELVAAYERGHFIRFMKWLRSLRRGI